ncbi:S9 family peptidase [Thioalkalivibrio sp. XN279]|uniref:S9 family peptidase n=1 Tax=Thioalkalivibrio sp. XN279 TaxID=2714953 RepID=UPI00140C82E6|nr:S9 family peptidase [Thioalkalivibrio sp. XN279]NHA15976.1 S9 family peptidase [Thioalkalivibrio sp. XN279]
MFPAKTRLLLLASLCAGFLLQPAPAAAAGLELRQLHELRQVGEVAMSPDGALTAYTVGVPRQLFVEEDGPAWSELHIIDARGPGRGYVVGQVNVSALAWTPDGATVTFLAKRGEDETRRLYGIDTAGGEARQLLAHATDIKGYSLSPDGTRVAFIARAEETEALEEARKHGFSQRVYEEDVRPYLLYIAPLDGAGETRVLELEGSAQEVRWSPAGDRLAVKLSPRELIDDVLMRTRVFFVAADTGAVLGAVDTPGKVGRMAWAPDGRHLGLVMAADLNDPREGRLAVVGRDGGTPRDLLPGLEGHVWHLGWRGADRLLYISYEGVEARLGEIGIDGRGDRTLAADGPIWDALSVSADGRTVALGAHAPAHPREVFHMAGRRAPQRLTVSNPWLEDVPLARQEVVRYRARDGLELEGLLIHPLERAEGARVPLILAVHGGPEAHYSNGWLSSYAQPGQAAAARGYAVFYPNYRASTGRGVAFSKLNHGRPAAAEFDDLVDGVDHLVAIGLVDADRVGITGGSYGGYASAWGATRYSERFAAAVMFVGISDKISMLGTSDIPTELYHVHYQTWPWENWALYREASPIFHAANSRTPTLILHGEADPRVDRSQSMILYRYLKLLGQAPVRLVLYPGEGHGNQRAASRWDYTLRLVRWMDHYLQGDGGAPPAYPVDARAAWEAGGD